MSETKTHWEIILEKYKEVLEIDAGQEHVLGRSEELLLIVARIHYAENPLVHI